MLSAVPLPIQEELRNKLNAELLSFSFTAGGCINHGGKLITKSGICFLKWNDASGFPEMFRTEANGLMLLGSSNVVAVPKVIACGKAESYQFLLLEFIESGTQQTSYWNTLGQQLARLHRISHAHYGLDHDNFIGSLPQVNSVCADWIDFYVDRRLRAQVKLAADSGRISLSIAKQFDALYEKLPTLLSEEMPSLLHGDLWSGNVIVNSSGMPCLIDPAVYFGHREIELAFTELFGGFEEAFYEAYNYYFPLLPEYSDRKPLYQLYPLMVHVNLFGGGYVSQVVSILKKFV